MKSQIGKQKSCIILHGVGGDSTENWFPWLKDVLQDEGIKADVPNLPHSLHPKAEEWVECIDSLIDPHAQTVLVGHSLGATAILRFLETDFSAQLLGAFLVATPITDLGWPDLAASGFFTARFNWEKIHSKRLEITVIQSDDDPYVPLEHGEQIADGLGVELVVETGAKHFNVEADFIQYPNLRDRIVSLFNDSY